MLWGKADSGLEDGKALLVGGSSDRAHGNGELGWIGSLGAAR